MKGLVKDDFKQSLRAAGRIAVKDPIVQMPGCRLCICDTKLYDRTLYDEMCDVHSKRPLVPFRLSYFLSQEWQEPYYFLRQRHSFQLTVSQAARKTTGCHMLDIGKR